MTSLQNKKSSTSANNNDLADELKLLYADILDVITGSADHHARTPRTGCGENSPGVSTPIPDPAGPGFDYSILPTPLVPVSAHSGVPHFDSLPLHPNNVSEQQSTGKIYSLHSNTSSAGGGDLDASRSLFMSELHNGHVRMPSLESDHRAITRRRFLSGSAINTLTDSRSSVRKSCADIMDMSVADFLATPSHISASSLNQLDAPDTCISSSEPLGQPRSDIVPITAEEFNIGRPHQSPSSSSADRNKSSSRPIISAQPKSKPRSRKSKAPPPPKVRKEPNFLSFVDQIPGFVPHVPASASAPVSAEDMEEWQSRLSPGFLSDDDVTPEAAALQEQLGDMTVAAKEFLSVMATATRPSSKLKHLSEVPRPTSVPVSLPKSNRTNIGNMTSGPVTRPRYPGAYSQLPPFVPNAQPAFFLTPSRYATHVPTSYYVRPAVINRRPARTVEARLSAPPPSAYTSPAESDQIPSLETYLSDEPNPDMSWDQFIASVSSNSATPSEAIAGAPPHLQNNVPDMTSHSSGEIVPKVSSLEPPMSSEINLDIPRDQFMASASTSSATPDERITSAHYPQSEVPALRSHSPEEIDLDVSWNRFVQSLSPRFAVYAESVLDAPQLLKDEESTSAPNGAVNIGVPLDKFIESLAPASIADPEGTPLPPASKIAFNQSSLLLKPLHVAKPISDDSVNFNDPIFNLGNVEMLAQRQDFLAGEASRAANTSSSSSSQSNTLTNHLALGNVDQFLQSLAFQGASFHDTSLPHQRNATTLSTSQAAVSKRTLKRVPSFYSLNSDFPVPASSLPGHQDFTMPPAKKAKYNEST